MICSLLPLVAIYEQDLVNRYFEGCFSSNVQTSTCESKTQGWYSISARDRTMCKVDFAMSSKLQDNFLFLFLYF